MNILETTIVGDGDHFLFTFEGSDLQIKCRSGTTT